RGREGWRLGVLLGEARGPRGATHATRRRPRHDRPPPRPRADVLHAACREPTHQGAPPVTDQRCCCGPSCCGSQPTENEPESATTDAATPGGDADGESVRATVRERYGEA